MDEDLRRISNLTRQMFDEKKQIVGMVIFVPKTRTAMEMTWKNDDEKDRLRDSFKDYCTMHGVGEFIMVSESWMSRNTSLRPSKDPNRREILMCGLISLKKGDVVYAEILEKEGERCLSEWHTIEGEWKSPYWEECLFRPSGN